MPSAGGARTFICFWAALHVGPCAVARIGHAQGVLRGGAQVFSGLLEQRHELAAVVFLTRGFAGDNDPFLGVGHGLRVVGKTVLLAHLHAAGLGFERVIVRASVGGQLGQALFDLFA